MFGSGTAQRVSHMNGGDIETPAGVAYVKKLLEEKRPEINWISPECGPYSPMQNLNMRSTAQRQQLQEKRAHALKQYQGACEIALHAYSLRIPFVIELSEKCQGWNLEPFLNLQKKVECVSGVCKGCQVGLQKGGAVAHVGNQ